MDRGGRLREESASPSPRSRALSDAEKRPPEIRHFQSTIKPVSPVKIFR
jgi:hypothetical protein